MKEKEAANILDNALNDRLLLVRRAGAVGRQLRIGSSGGLLNSSEAGFDGTVFGLILFALDLPALRKSQGGVGFGALHKPIRD